MDTPKPISNLTRQIQQQVLENGQKRKNDFSDSPDYPYPFTPKKLDTYRAELAQQPVAKSCPGCGGLGYVKKGNFPVGHPDFGKIEHCQLCNLERRAAWLSANCGLTASEQQAGLTGWKVGNFPGLDETTQQSRRKQRIAAGQAIRKAVEERVGLYTFWGDFGAGKSYALQIIANEARLRMIESFYAPFSLLLEHLRSLYDKKMDSSLFWERLLDIPVLCLDEVTRFNETGWAREKLFTLTDTRYRRRASHLTVFGTNEDPSQLLSTGEDVGYLYSRMRQGIRLELRGDMREAAG